MKRYFYRVVIILALLLTSTFYSEAQVPLKMRLMTDTGDMITTNEPAIKSYYMGGDGTLTLVLQDPLNFGLTDPPIGIGTGMNCTIPGDGSVRATEGSTFSFGVNSSDPGATLSAPVRPYNGTGVQATFSNGNLQWSTVSGDTGTYLAVFQAVNGAKTSQIVVMIKIGAAETVTSPTTISGPSTGTAGVSYPFTASGSTSSLTHAVEYQFDWGDGTFTGWSASSQSHAYTTANTYNIKVKARCVPDHTESAWSSSHPITISNVPTYTLTVTAGTGGAAANITAAGPGPYAAGTAVTIQATPSTGYTFSSWSGGATGATNPLTFNMPSSNVTVTANFTSNTPPPAYTLTVTYASKLGSVTLSPPGGSYSAGKQVKITATPYPLRTFTGWSGDATGTITGTTNPITITMPSSNVTATANFR